MPTSDPVDILPDLSREATDKTKMIDVTTEEFEDAIDDG